MDYLDFELEIGVGSGREYPVTVVRSSAGEAREHMRFPFDELTLESQLKDVQIALLRSGGTRRTFLLPEERTVREFGGALFNALFTGDVRAQYAVIQDQARAKDWGVRLKLRIQAPELAALPWEFLYDTRIGNYLCLSSYTPIVRYPEVAQAPQVLSVTAPLSILAMTASPRDWKDLDLQRERERLEKALKPVQDKGQVKLTWLEGHTWFDLQKAIRRGPWHIFHFIGHGGFSEAAQEVLIVLENEKGKVYRLYAMRLSQLLTDHHPLRLVVLNSCEGAKGNDRDVFSSTAATLVRNGIPAVLAMQFEITDKAAMAFSRSFYDALADGLPVDTAVSEARKAINLEVENTLEWGTPVLYMRSPDGVLFDLRQPLTTQSEKPVTVTPSFSPSTVGHTEQVVPQHAVRDFFISYNSADRGWAEWIAWQLEEIGYSIILQDWDFRPGSNFVLDMQKATQETKRTIVVLSPHYLNARFTQSEWAVAFQQDPKGEQGVLLPIRVQECKPEGLLGTIIYIDLVGLDESAAREKLLVDVRFGRGKPMSPPVFPEKVSRSMMHQPIFPGEHRNTIIPLEGRPVPNSNGHSLQRWQMPRRFSRRMFVVGLVGGLSAAGGITWLILNEGPRVFPPRLSPTATPTPVLQGTTLFVYRGHYPTYVYAAVWSPTPNSMLIASGGDDQTVQVWNASTGKKLITYPGHAGHVTTVRWSPDGKRIASGSYDTTVQVWDANTGGNAFIYSGHQDRVGGVTWSPDSKRIASGSSDLTVQVWDATTGSKLVTYRGHSKVLQGVAWSPDGTRIASGSNDNTVQVWDAATGSHAFIYREHTSAVNGVAWSHDSTFIASTSFDDTVHVWEPATGVNRVIYRGHSSSVVAAAWSPDDKFIVSASYDHTAQIWDAVDGSHVFTYPGHTKEVRAVAWSPNGKYIVTGSWDGTVQVWEAL